MPKEAVRAVERSPAGEEDGAGEEAGSEAISSRVPVRAVGSKAVQESVVRLGRAELEIQL